MAKIRVDRTIQYGSITYKSGSIAEIAHEHVNEILQYGVLVEGEPVQPVEDEKAKAKTTKRKTPTKKATKKE